ncbi:LytR C-terminal domain-containing protein [Citricoccus sp.]|uniref:LytR C-terminal domain-containing protein n=1 Tax=Citricoccus sp. TaxID=1978372 RepID=UPI00262EAD0C|nr:LytR C-terminal domain-containing protein [Citricoccus sp.]HRO30516.1 LytR C-terminal domain-containing protein [Citricoccus sp.]
MTEYPRDQFDDVPEYRNRKGGHRAVAEPSGGTGPSGLTWISLAAALALVIGAFSYFILPTLRVQETARPGAAEASVSGSAAPGQATSPGMTRPGSGAGTADPSASGTARAASSSAPPARSPEPSTTPRKTTTPQPTKTPEPTPTPTQTQEPQTVDYSFPVEVYNASRVNGLAGRVGGTLSGSGFTVATAGNWSGYPVSSSAVFYSSNPVTAQAVAAGLGLPAVYDGRIPGIAVVVTASYAG